MFYVLSAIFGAAVTLGVRIIFERYTNHRDKVRYALALAHEIQLVTIKLDQYAKGLDTVKHQFDEEEQAFPYIQPPDYPFTNHDSLIHRSLISHIGTLDFSLAAQILTFYDDVRGLEEWETDVLQVHSPDEAFDAWVDYRRKLSARGNLCVDELHTVATRPVLETISKELGGANAPPSEAQSHDPARSGLTTTGSKSCSSASLAAD